MSSPLAGVRDELSAYAGLLNKLGFASKESGSEMAGPFRANPPLLEHGNLTLSGWCWACVGATLFIVMASVLAI